MHEAVSNYARMVSEGQLANPAAAPGTRVVEVGSLDINGTVRQFFTARGVVDYVGIDKVPGRGVDVVGFAAHVLDRLPAQSVDVVLYLNTLEHDPEFWFTLQAIGGVLRRGGHLVVCAPGVTFGEHDKPDYWRCFMAAVPVLHGLAKCQVRDVRPDGSGFMSLGERQ